MRRLSCESGARPHPEEPPGPRSIDAVRVLRISVTDVCSLRCIYCMPPGRLRRMPKSEILSYEEITDVVEVAIACGIRQFKLTGGEPLARRDLPELVGQLSELKGRGVDDLSLTTNGTLLAGQAARLRNNGLDRVTISLDTLEPAKYRRITRGGDLGSVWAGLEAARAAGFAHPKINVVVMRGINDQELRDFAGLTIDRPATVRFIEHMPLGRSGIERRDVFVPAEEILGHIASLGRLVPAEPDVGSGPAKLFRLPGAKGKIGLIAAMSQPFCRTCNRLRLTADGRLRSCLFDGGQVDLRGLLRPLPNQEGLVGAFHACVQLKPIQHGYVGRGQMSRIGG